MTCPTMYCILCRPKCIRSVCSSNPNINNDDVFRKIHFVYRLILFRTHWRCKFLLLSAFTSHHQTQNCICPLFRFSLFFFLSSLDHLHLIRPTVFQNLLYVTLLHHYCAQQIRWLLSLTICHCTHVSTLFYCFHTCFPINLSCLLCTLLLHHSTETVFHHL